MNTISMRNARFPRVILSSLLGCSLVVTALHLSSCSKKEDTGAGDSSEKKSLASSSEPSILTLPLLAKIPSTSAAVVSIDTTGDSFKKYLASPWGGAPGSMFNMVTLGERMKSAGTDPADVPGYDAMLQLYKKIGIIGEDGSPAIHKVASAAVMYCDTPPVGNEQNVDVGFFLEAAPGANLKEKLALISTLLAENQIPAEKESFNGAEGFKIALPNMTEGSTETTTTPFYFAATEKRLAIGRVKSIVENVFSNGETDGFSAVKGSPEFQRALSAVNGAQDQWSLVYANVQKFIPALSAIAKKGTTENPEFDPATIPVDGFIITQGMNSAATSKFAVLTTPRSENQKTIFAALDGAGLSQSALGLPADTALALAFDSRMISKLEPLMKDLSGEAAVEGLRVVKSLLSTTIGIRNNDGGSPFPDLFISLDSSSRDDISKLIETSVGGAMAMSGAPMGDLWQSKDIAGSAVRFMNTPFGVGAYMASPPGSQSLKIATSERAVKDLLGAASGTASLLSSISGPVKSAASAGKLGMVYLNFGKIADLLESAKNSMAMFGASSADFDKMVDLPSIRALGTGAFSLGYSAGVFNGETAFEAPAAVKAAS